MGARYVFEALAENGFQELALDISTSVEQPSFGYMALGTSRGQGWNCVGEMVGNCHDYGEVQESPHVRGTGVYLHRIAGISGANMGGFI